MPGKKRLLTHGGETLSISDWAKRTGLSTTTITSRLDKLGWSVDRALTEPKKGRPLASPKARKVRVPKLRRHKSSGQAFVWWKKKFHYLGKYGSAAASARYAEFVRQHCQPELVEGVESVGDLVAAFWQWARSEYTKGGKPTGEVYNFRSVIADLADGYGDLPADAFGPQQLQAVRRKFIARKHNGRPWSRRHVNEQINRVRRIFAWGVGEGVVKPEAIAALREVRPLKKGKSAAPESDRRGAKPVDWETVEKTLPHMPAGLAAMVQAHYLIGCRAGEIVLMREVDVNRKASDTCWLWTPESRKLEHLESEGMEAKHWIGPRAQAILGPMFDRKRKTEYVFTPAYRRRRPDALRRWTRDSYYRAVKAACAAAGVASWTPKQLRKARATDIEAVEGLDAASAVLAHTDVNTTARHYAARSNLARDVQARLG